MAKEGERTLHGKKAERQTGNLMQASVWGLSAFKLEFTHQHSLLSSLALGAWSSLGGGTSDHPNPTTALRRVQIDGLSMVRALRRQPNLSRLRIPRSLLPAPFWIFLSVCLISVFFSHFSFLGHTFPISLTPAVPISVWQSSLSARLVLPPRTSMADSETPCGKRSLSSESDGVSREHSSPPSKRERRETCGLSEALQAAEAKEPENLTVEDVVAFTKRYTHKVPLLIFAEIVEQACHGIRLQRIVESMEMVDRERLPLSSTRHLKMATLTSVFRSGGRHGAIALCEEDFSALNAAVEILAETSADPCERGSLLVDANEIIKIALPLMVTPADRIPLTDLVPLIDLLQDHSIIDASAGHCDDLAQWTRFEDWFELVLRSHPRLDAYLDPSLLLIEGVGGGAIPPGVLHNLAALPVGAGALLAAPTPLPVPGFPAGSTAVWTCHSSSDARAISIALRGLHAKPAGGGGPGALCCIGRTSTTGAGFVFI